jgi:hypothetical protein
MFLKVKKHPVWKNAGIPCCRSDPASTVDHFEPRMPEVNEDGTDVTRWLYKQEKDQENPGKEPG